MRSLKYVLCVSALVCLGVQSFSGEEHSGGMPSVEEQFKEMDTNHDKKISLKEFEIDIYGKGIENMYKDKRIKELERMLENRTEELDLLKKAERFFEKRKQ